MITDRLTPPSRRALLALVQRGPLSVYDFPSYGHTLQRIIELGWVRRNDGGLFEITDLGREIVSESSQSNETR